MSAAADAVARFAPAERTLPVMLRRQAERFGDRILVRAGGERWSFADAARIAAGFAGRLAQAGIAPGDRVALLCGNRLEFLQCFLGCAWAGAIPVPINTASRGAQLRHILLNSGARLLIAEQDALPALDHVDPDALALSHVWVIGDAPDSVRGLPAAKLPPLADALPPAPVRPGDTLAILYTSGTTGPSKGVCCPQAQYFWWGVNTAGLLGLREGDMLSTSLPLFHTNALNAFFQALLTGSTLAVERRFSASGFWRGLAESGATVTYLLGAMVPILLSRPPAAEERAHNVRVALAPAVPAHFHAPFRDRTGIAFVDGYGSTETNFVIGAPADRQVPGGMGTAAPGFQARVVDADDTELPDGQPGELVLRADQPFAFATGYWAMPEATVQAWRNLWFHTGDRVVRDAGGEFRFLDRMKDAIRRRGENVSSFEVEQALLSHPEVATAAAFAVPSELAEDEVMAAVVRRAGSTLTAPELARFCAPLLPRFAAPRFIDFLDELPVTESGKVRKYALRARGVTATTWDREASGERQRR